MRVVIQRVSKASVEVDGATTGAIGAGYLVLAGVEVGDQRLDMTTAAHKIINLRVMPDEDGQMNRSILESGGEILVVSQFTLVSDVRKGRRPSFVRAAHPSDAEPLLGQFIDTIRNEGVRVASGVFGANMDVSLINDGPVTVVMDIKEGKVL